jgi:hypothetical protein
MNNDKFDMLASIEDAKLKKEERDKFDQEQVVNAKYTPFDFINSVSHNKKDLIANDDQPDVIEKQYNPYIVNRGFSLHSDTILHANEMNTKHHLFKGAQYYYYLGALRSRERRSKWYKLEKDTNLDAIQEYYQCNRLVAKQYMSVLPPEELKNINNKVSKGGAGK